MNLLIPGTLTVAAYAAFAPISAAKNGEAVGRDIEFLRRFAAQHGLGFTVRFFPFAGLWERPGKHEADLAAAGIAPLPERQAAGVVWSDPYFAVQRAILVRASDELQLRSIEDFAGRTIAVTQGSTAEQDVRSRKPATARSVYYADQNAALMDLSEGRIDGYATGDASCHYLVERYPGRFAIADVHQYVLPEHFAFAVREASGILHELNAFIGQHRATY
jgi:polar amino acid transport system substrate-binding protein